jgi:mRNA interferase MazF
MKRGDIVVVAVPGDYGKPRPAVLVQADALAIPDGSLIVCMMTTQADAVPALRLRIAPEPSNGLREPSAIMVDKLFTLARGKVRGPIGRLSPEQLSLLDTRLATVLGLAAPRR